MILWLSKAYPTCYIWDVVITSLDLEEAYVYDLSLVLAYLQSGSRKKRLVQNQ